MPLPSEPHACSSAGPVPGSRLPLVAQTLLWWYRPAWFLERCRRLYGNTFRLRLPATPMGIVTSDPVAVREVFSRPTSNFRVPDSQAMVLEPFLGKDSLLLLDGERHLAERRRLAQAFHGERIETYRRIMTEVTQRDMATWPLGAPFALRPHMQTITFEVILRAVFGVADDDGPAALRATMKRLAAYSGSLVLLPALRRDLGPLSPWGRFSRRRAAVDHELLALIRKRRDDPQLAERADILSLLLQSGDDAHDRLSDAQLRDELLTMLFAGHETTATAMAWAFDLLLHHRAALERLTEELDQGGDRYLDAVVKETLRLRPVISEVGRTLTHPMHIGRWDLPEAAVVAANIFLIHRDPELFPAPLSFRPERFLDDSCDASAWIPFGGGVRRCLGAAFATEEMRIVLRTVLAHSQLRAANPSQEKLRRRAVTLIPRTGTKVILDARRA